MRRKSPNLLVYVAKIMFFHLISCKKPLFSWISMQLALLSLYRIKVWHHVLTSLLHFILVASQQTNTSPIKKRVFGVINPQGSYIFSVFAQKHRISYHVSRLSKRDIKALKNIWYQIIIRQEDYAVRLRTFIFAKLRIALFISL